MADNLTTANETPGKAERATAAWQANPARAASAGVDNPLQAKTVDLSDPISTTGTLIGAQDDVLERGAAMWADLTAGLRGGNPETALGNVAEQASGFESEAADAQARAEALEDRATRFDSMRSPEDLLYWDGQVRKMGADWVARRFLEACSTPADRLMEADALLLDVVLRSVDSVPIVPTPLLQAGWRLLASRHVDAPHVEALRSRASTLRQLAATARVHAGKQAERLGLGDRWAEISAPAKSPKALAADTKFRGFGRTIQNLADSFNTGKDQAIVSALLAERTTDSHRKAWGKR